MACCLAVALVIAVVRAGWYRLVPGRRPARAGFAPPARRPAPGEAGAVVATPATAPATAPAAPSVAAAVEPVWGSDPAGRSGGPVSPRRVPARQRVGFALVLAGAGWTVVSAIAMGVPLGAAHHHGVLGPTVLPGSLTAEPITHGFGLAGLLMHGPGLVAIAIGALLTLGTAASRRPSHHTLIPRPERAL